MKRQATKAERSQIELHIQRQRELGESMIDDDDQPALIEFLVTGGAILVMAILFWIN